MKIIAFLLLAGAALAQVTTSPPSVTASGQATITAQPDQAQISIGVTTQAQTAQAAGTQNAAQVQAVLAALNPIVGSNGTIQTIGYSVTPNYTTQSGQSVLTGYTVTNTVQVTTSDLNSVGRLIDAATQAGATNIQSLGFGLKDDQPQRAQALRLAAAQARTQADAIAGGLGLHTVRVISAEEGSSTVTSPLNRLAAGGSATPIQPGTVQVQATVTVKMEMSQ